MTNVHNDQCALHKPQNNMLQALDIQRSSINILEKLEVKRKREGYNKRSKQT